MPWEVQSHQGIHLPQIGWWLDASRAVARSFVTHAHSDHIAGHREIVCTAATARLMRVRVGGRRTEHVLPFGQAEQLTEACAATLLPAGHILGSAQVLLDHYDHGRLLYTGDFNLRASLAAEPCAVPRADVLIMETTFGLPRYVFPPAERVAAELVGFCRETLAAGAVPVLYAYSLGKSQEVLQVVGRAGLPVMMHAQACKLTRIYEEFGTVCPPYSLLDPEKAAGHVVIRPPPADRRTPLGKIGAVRTAVVTGWAIDASTRYRERCDAAFALSDHADYNDLLAFVARVGARRVLTVHGFAREFAQTLRRQGIDAWALGEENQLELPVAAPAGP